MVKKPVENTPNKDDEEEEGGKGGKGGRGGSGGGSGFIPTYDDLIAVSPEEAEIARNAKDALFAERVSLKSAGYKVEALDKKQQLRKQMTDPRMAAELAAGGSNLEAHPELPETAGVFDDIAFPESEPEAAASNDPDLALRNQMKMGLGMGGLSMQTAREELKKEEKLRARPNIVPEQKPEYVIRPAAPPPSPRPRPF